MAEEKKVPDSFNAETFKVYEDGKHRRYELLFAVNGGAFAVAKFLVGKDAAVVLGSLTLRQLSIGMVLFTALMTADIFAFGQKMRRYLPGTFTWEGKTVLIMIGSLICAGWISVAGWQFGWQLK